jgi:hypothetical protein
VSQVQTGVLTHDQTVNKSEGAHQAAVAAAGSSQPAVNAAAITHYRACLVSALANKCGTDPFMAALRSLGVNF